MVRWSRPPRRRSIVELKLPARAELLQFRKHVPLQGLALMLEVRERRADEDLDDRQAPAVCLIAHYAGMV